MECTCGKCDACWERRLAAARAKADEMAVDAKPPEYRNMKGLPSYMTESRFSQPARNLGRGAEHRPDADHNLYFRGEDSE